MQNERISNDAGTLLSGSAQALCAVLLCVMVFVFVAFWHPKRTGIAVTTLPSRFHACNGGLINVVVRIPSDDRYNVNGNWIAPQQAAATFRNLATPPKHKRPRVIIIAGPEVSVNTFVQVIDIVESAGLHVAMGVEIPT